MLKWSGLKCDKGTSVFVAHLFVDRFLYFLFHTEKTDLSDADLMWLIG